MKPIITVMELLELKNDKNLLIFDASNRPNARDEYLKNHLKGAFFIDINTELADIKDNLSWGGRHPLPALHDFSKTLSKFGMHPDSHVIIYDHAHGANAAARFWWMLKGVGIPNVQVLEGGIEQAASEGFPIVSGEEELPQPTNFICNAWHLPTVSIEMVEEASKTKDAYIIDVREEARYRGVSEPFDPVAGHIPNAHNIPYTENLSPNGTYLKPEKLKEKYAAIFENYNPENIIIHCGSGVTACHTILAMNYAGFQIPSLYVGSWSEWCRNAKEMITP